MARLEIAEYINYLVFKKVIEWENLLKAAMQQDNKQTDTSTDKNTMTGRTDMLITKQSD